MTVYTGTVLAAYNYLNTIVLATGTNIEAAPIATRLSLVAASKALVDGADAAIGTLDTLIATPGASTLSVAVSGAFPPDIITAITAEQANIAQMNTLLDIRGYAGRILINSIVGAKQS